MKRIEKGKDLFVNIKIKFHANNKNKNENV